jgi:hypothetical protein
MLISHAIYYSNNGSYVGYKFNGNDGFFYEDNKTTVKIDYEKIFLTNDNIIFFENINDTKAINLSDRTIIEINKNDRKRFKTNLSERQYITIKNEFNPEDYIHIE